MKKYEMVIILNPRLNVKDEKKIVTDMEDKIKEYGNIENKDDKGILKLAYRVKKYDEGHYIIYMFEADNEDATPAIERLCRIRDEILKFIIIKQ